MCIRDREMGDHCGSLQEIINLTENLDCYEIYPDIHDYEDVYKRQFPMWVSMWAVEKCCIAATPSSMQISTQATGNPTFTLSGLSLIHI